MVSPQVSHDSWERTRGLTQIVLGTHQVKAENLSFDTQVETLCEAFHDAREEYGEIENLAGTHLQDWPNGVVIEIQPDAQDRPHRPTVEESTIAMVDRAVNEIKEAIPTDETDFDEKLQLVLDWLESVFSRFNGRLEEVSED